MSIIASYFGDEKSSIEIGIWFSAICRTWSNDKLGRVYQEKLKALIESGLLSKESAYFETFPDLKLRLAGPLKRGDPLKRKAASALLELVDSPKSIAPGDNVLYHYLSQVTTKDERQSVSQHSFT